MAGIVITGMENIDEEVDGERLERERAARLREDRLRRTQQERDRQAQINQQVEADAAKQKQTTSVEVQNTPNGTKTTTTTSSPTGTQTTTTVQTEGAKTDDPFTEEVEGENQGADKPQDPPKTEEPINTEEAKKEQEEIEGFKESQIDPKTENELLKEGIDTSDIKVGEENTREAIPETPKQNPSDPVVNKNENNGNADTQTEHCTLDNKPQGDQQQQQQQQGDQQQEDQQQEDQQQQQQGDQQTEEKKQENVLIGEDPNAPKSEIVIPDASATCPSPNLNSLNDFQKEVLWVAMDMLKWQPTTDLGNKGRKKFWEYYSKGGKNKDTLTSVGVTEDSFYNSYKYPDDPTFGRFKHKNAKPLDRLLSFFSQMDNKNVDIKKAPTWAWCAVTASVIYMFAMMRMQAKHKDIKKQSNKGSSIWSPFENKTIQVPYSKSTFSAAVVATNATNFGYKLSWEPTPGAIMFKINNEGATGDCGHAGIVIDKTKDGSMITVEGNGGDDLHIRVWPRDNYYQDAWRVSHEAKYIKNQIFNGGKILPLKDCTDNQIKRGRLIGQNHCGYNGSEKYWVNANLPYPYPTDSHWHWCFVNPATETELLDIKGTPSREGNPLAEFYSMLDGFYNPEGSRGVANSNATD